MSEERIEGRHGSFDSTVAVQIEGQWWHIVNASQALECLQKHFPAQEDSSLIRARSTCSLYLEGKVSMEGAKSAFVVAAMAAGFPFETGEQDELFEIEVSKAIDEGLRELLFYTTDTDDAEPPTS